MSSVEIDLTESEALKIMRALAARFPAAAVVVGDEAQNRAAPADRSVWQHPLDVAAMEAVVVAIGRINENHHTSPSASDIIDGLNQSLNQALRLLIPRIGNGRARDLLLAAGVRLAP